MEGDPSTCEAYLVIEEVLSEAILDGRARVDVARTEGLSGWCIDVVPSNPTSCSIFVLADSPPGIDLFIGREPTRASLELWEDRERNLARLREMVGAIAEGRYEQRIRTRKRNRIEVNGQFHFDNGTEAHSYAGDATATVEPGQSYALRFDPF